MGRAHRLLLAGGVLALLPLGVAGASPQPPSQGDHGTVEMGSNFYSPREIRVDVGGTVEWEAVADNHDVRADDGSFHLWRDQKSRSGERRSQTFEEEGVVRYYCTLHGGPGGSGMAGIVYVGDAELETAPDLYVPSEEHPTLRAALRDARDGSTIHLAPGVHRAGDRVAEPGVTIQGTGDEPGEVVLRAATSTGLRIWEDRTTVRNLRIESGSSSGIEASGVDRLRLEDVEIATEQVGVRFAGGRGLTMHGGRVEGHERAGVHVSDCDPCDAHLEGVTVTGNRTGIDVVDAAGVFLRGNEVVGNGGGIRAAATPADPTASPRTLVITGNRLRDNVAGFAAGPDPELALPSGAAVWLAGARQAVVHDNEIEGDHSYGVAVTALAGGSIDVAVRRNVVSGAREADLAWDGLGAQVCFAGNTTPEGDEPTSQPEGAQRLYDCDAPATVGVPNPQPLVGLGSHAWSSEDDEDQQDAEAAATRHWPWP